MRSIDLRHVLLSVFLISALMGWWVQYGKYQAASRKLKTQEIVDFFQAKGGTFVFSPNASSNRDLSELRSYAESDCELPERVIAAIASQQLETLVLSGYNSKDFGPIAEIASLEYLDLSETNLSEPALLKLALLPNLKEINVRRCDQISEQSIQKFIRESNNNSIIETSEPISGVRIRCFLYADTAKFPGISGMSR